MQSTAQQITISFAGFNRAWAAWIGHRLERQGCRVAFQRWNPPVEVPLEDALNDLLLVEGRILVVLSDWYFKLGPRTDEAWNDALRTVVAPNAHRFAAVSVDSQAATPSATTAFGGTAELWGVGAREAERRLLSALGITHASTATDTPATGVTPRYPHEQPRVWGGVPRRNTRFTGREHTLQTVYELLQRAEPGAGVVTLLGISGVGKTQVAAEYVFRFSSEYDVVWWVPADQRGTLRQRLAELAPSLGLTTGHEYGERLRAVADALRRGTPYRRWLLVLDGADAPQSVADMLPTGTGHVLITSQNREWGDYNTMLYDVPVYERDESVAFIRRRAHRIGPTEADLLADALGDHPLALDQTAGWLSDSTVTIPQYVEMLRSGSENIEAALRISSDFPMTYYTAFSILLNRLRETAPEAVNVLRLCAFFAPGDIPVQLLRAIPAESLPEELTGVLDDPIRWNTAVNKLAQYSVIQWNTPDADAGTEPEDAGSIYLHRMVSQTVRAGMSEEDRTIYSRAVRRGLTAADPLRAVDPRNWPRYARIAPHLGASGALRSTHRDMRGLIFNCLRYFEAAGEYRGGIQLAEQARAAWSETYGDDDPQVWYLMSLHAMLLRNLGAYTRAEEIDRAVVARYTAAAGPRDLSTLRVQEGLGGDLRGLGQYQESLEVSQDVLDGYLELIGENDYRTLNARNQVATSLRLLGRYEESAAADRLTLALRREVLGPRHRSSLWSETMFASDLRLLGRYDEARSVQEEGLEVHRLVLGKDHPYTILAELNLAMCLLRSGDRDTARSHLTDLLERSERVLGPNAPLAIRVAASYTCAEREYGNVDRAREVGEHVVERYRSNFGPRHPYTVGTAANQAVLLRAAGELQSSQVLIEECLTSMVAALGPDHPWTLGVALNVSAGRNREGDVEGALDLSRDTERRAAAAVGARHPLHLSAQVALALDLRALRRRTEADKVEGEALSGLSTTLGTQHVHTLSARSRTRPYWDFEPL